MKTPDIDIDFACRDEALFHLKHIPASRYDGDLVRHNVGVYFQDIPIDPITGLSSIPYKEAEERDYFKMDFLNLDLYQKIEDEQHLISLLEKEPDWDILQDRYMVGQLNQIHSQFDIVAAYAPKTIEELAMILALIRPGKRHLIGKTFDEMKNEIWEQTESYVFKKSHAIAYAHTIVVQMNLLDGKKKTTKVVGKIIPS